jgi:hypothetical protein
MEMSLMAEARERVERALLSIEPVKIGDVKCSCMRTLARRSSFRQAPQVCDRRLKSP